MVLHAPDVAETHFGSVLLVSRGLLPGLLDSTVCWCGAGLFVSLCRGGHLLVSWLSLSGLVVQVVSVLVVVVILVPTLVVGGNMA